MLFYGILIAFSILVLTVNTQPTIASSGLAMEALEQYVGCVQGWWLCICMCICVCVWVSMYVSMYVFMYVYVYVYIYVYACICVYVYICVCLYVRICIYIYIYIYICICIDTSYLSILSGLDVVGTLFWCYCC